MAERVDLVLTSGRIGRHSSPSAHTKVESAGLTLADGDETIRGR